MSSARLSEANLTGARLKDTIFGNTIDPVRHALNIPILVVRG